MKQFKDLKVGDIIACVDKGYEFEITRIETSENSSLHKEYMRLYCNNGFPSYLVLKNTYCYDCGRRFPDYITPKENLSIFQEIWEKGIEEGKRIFRGSILDLFDID